MGSGRKAMFNQRLSSLRLSLLASEKTNKAVAARWRLGDLKDNLRERLVGRRAKGLWIMQMGSAQKREEKEDVIIEQNPTVFGQSPSMEVVGEIRTG
jgi:hypothetical protein